MNIYASFEEIKEYVEAHYGLSLDFKAKSPKEITISYEPKGFLKIARTSVEIGIDTVGSNFIVLYYVAGLAKDLVISGALKFLRHRYPELEDALISEPDNRIRVDLSRIPQAKPVLKTIALNDIRFDDSGVVVSFSLK